MKPTDLIDRILRKNLREARSRAVLADDLSLKDDLQAHDLDALQVVMDLEDEFHLDILDEEAECLRTIGDVRALVARKLGVEA